MNTLTDCRVGRSDCDPKSDIHANDHERTLRVESGGPKGLASAGNDRARSLTTLDNPTNLPTSNLKRRIRATRRPVLAGRFATVHQSDFGPGYPRSVPPYHAPVFAIEAQGSRGGSLSPFCSSSIEMPSGERMNAMFPSRGGRLMVTPASISRWHSA